MLELLKIAEVANILRVDQSTAYLWAKQGIFPVVRIGSSVRVPKEAFEKWLVEQVEYPEV